jgi:hypothetical protein
LRLTRGERLQVPHAHTRDRVRHRVVRAENAAEVRAVWPLPPEAPPYVGTFRLAAALPAAGPGHARSYPETWQFSPGRHGDAARNRTGVPNQRGSVREYKRRR